MNHIDRDPEETEEWNDSLESVVETQGHERGREIMLSLLKRSKDLQLGVPMVPTTDYINTIAPEKRYFSVVLLSVSDGHRPPSGPAIQCG